MIVTAEQIDSKNTRLSIDFADENVELSGTMLVAGDESTALAYAHFLRQI